MNNYKMPPTYRIAVQSTICVFSEEDVSLPRMVAVEDDNTQDMLVFFPEDPPTDETINMMVLQAIGDADSRCSHTYYMPTQPVALEDVLCGTVYVVPPEQIESNRPVENVRLYERAMVRFLLPRQTPRPPLL